MKTTINLSDYSFSGKNNPLYQISDHPTNKVDETLTPIPNTEYNSEIPVSPENYPFELVDAYDQFKEILVQLNAPILEVFINSNDEKKLFD